MQRDFEATSASTSETQISSIEDNIQEKFHDVPTGVEILPQGIYTSVGWIVAHDVLKWQFDLLAEENQHLDELWLLNGDLIYSEYISHRVHGRLCSAFFSLVDKYNQLNEPEVRLEFDRNLLAPYDARTSRAGNVLINNSIRLDNGMSSPNVVGEIGYTNGLEKLTHLAPIYLNDSAKNHTEFYFILKLCYPYSIHNPEQFQMVFLLYDRKHMPHPIQVVSCGTLPLSADVQAL